MTPRYNSLAWCPWAAADRLEVKIRFVAMSGGLLGACDWYTRSIYIRTGITDAQALCALAHEVKHVERGPLMCATELIRRREEASISREVARLLLPLSRLIDALAWSPHLADQAAVVGVDGFTMRTRLENLADWEFRQLHDLFGEEVA
jgi:hypothetical protein